MVQKTGALLIIIIAIDSDIVSGEFERKKILLDLVYTRAKRSDSKWNRSGTGTEKPCVSARPSRSQGNSLERESSRVTV